MKKMNINLNKFGSLLVGCALLAGFASCDEQGEAPTIDSVWYNMVGQPIEEAVCAYPGQTLCIRGQHLGDLQRLIVNGTDINLNTLFVYESDQSITFQLPADVSTEGDNIRVVTSWGMVDHPFVVRPASEQPAITAFSSTTLVVGRTLTITGTHLEGAEEVWLPLTYDGRVRCNLDGNQPSDSTTVHAVVPADANFATGRCEIVMTKNDAARGITYTEKVFSASTNFSN